MTALCTGCGQIISEETALQMWDFLLFVAMPAILLYFAPFKGKPMHFKFGLASFYILWGLVLAQTLTSLIATYYTTSVVVLDYLGRITLLGVPETQILRVAFFSLPILIFLNAVFYVFIHRRLKKRR